MNSNEGPRIVSSNYFALAFKVKIRAKPERSYHFIRFHIVVITIVSLFLAFPVLICASKIIKLKF